MINEMKDYEKSYIACFLDTDGTVTLRKKKKWFDPRIIFVNSEEIEILEKLRTITGIKGSIGTHCRYKNNKKEYRYEIDRHDSVELLLKKIFPFMKLSRKKKIIELLFEYFNIRHKIIKKDNKRPKSEDFIKRMFKIQKEIARLNKK